MTHKKNFTIGLIAVIAIAIMVAVWIKTETQEITTNLPTAQHAIVSDKTASEELDDIANVSNSNNLNDIDAEVNIDVNLDDLDNLDNILDTL